MVVVAVARAEASSKQAAFRELAARAARRAALRLAVAEPEARRWAAPAPLEMH